MTYSETIDYLFNAAPLFQQIGGKAYKPGLKTTLTLDEHLGILTKISEPSTSPEPTGKEVAPTRSLPSCNSTATKSGSTLLHISLTSEKESE